MHIKHLGKVVYGQLGEMQGHIYNVKICQDWMLDSYPPGCGE